MQNPLKNFYQNNFVYSGKEKLSKLTISFIILLNIFIFITLGLGIDFQIKVLNNPSVTFSSQCRNIVSSNSLNDFNNYVYFSKNYNGKYQSIKNEEMDARCSVILNKKLKAVKSEHNIKVLRNNEKKLNTKQSLVSSELSYIRENYNTVLFEKISAQESSKSIIKDNLSSENIKSKYNSYVKQNEDLKKEKVNIRKSFAASKSVKELSTFISVNKKQIQADYKSSRKSYEIKKELIALIFLLPLLLVAFYIMKKYLKDEKYTLYIMFKNIVVVILIPTIISFLSLIYILLPKIFLEKVLKFFYQIEIPFIVYYFAIAVFILIFGYIIVKVQKRHRENIKSLSENSISKTQSYNKSVCNKCSNKVDYLNMNFCPCCKNELKVKCENCNEDTIKSLNNCFNCGEDL
jgi:hypothetical protein